MNEFSQELNELIREIRIIYTTRGIEDGFPAPSLEELANEYELSIKLLKAAHVRQDWDDERKKNERYFKEQFDFDRKQQLSSTSKDLATRLGNIMSQRLDYLERAATLIDSKLSALLEDPDAYFKLADLIKLKELHSKEATSIITTAVSLKEKLLGNDDAPKSIGVGEGNYIDALRTAFEVQKALANENTELAPEAEELFTRLDNE